MGGAIHDLELYDVPAADLQAPVVIHPTAIVEKGADLGRGVRIGPFCVIGAKAVIGDNVHIGSHCTVEGRTTIGARTSIHQFCSIGVAPQDLKYTGEDTTLTIGEENSLRQYVNISLGSDNGGGQTIIGRRNLFMVYSHVAHDCVVGDNIVFANGATLGGHVTVDSYAVLGGCCAVHQFCKIGPRAMIGGGSMVVQDVPPYTMVQGDRAKPIGLNIVGLKRAGLSMDSVRDIKAMYRLLYSEGLTVDDCLLRIEAEVSESDYRRVFTDFLRSSERGVCR